jgi:hypothetical protein
LKTRGKSVDSHIYLGDIDGDSNVEIVQSVGTNLYLIKVLDEE